MAIGFDAGTYNLICSKRNETNEIKSKKTVNAFIELPLENRFMFNMLKDKVKMIERDKVAYVVGQPAIDMAYTIPLLNLKRPMADGCLNPKERNAFEILKIMIHSLIGEIEKDKEILYYSVPANAINTETDADFHSNVLLSIFKAYNVNNKRLQAFPINEALALVFAELGNKMHTGVGISFGAGMVNLCYSIFAQPVFQMSLVNSGDWIDKMAAKACGESPTVINQEKTKIDLTKTPTSLVERAIKSQYEILIQKTTSAIKKAIVDAGAKAVPGQPLDVILGGGTASPPGFVELFKQGIKEADWSIPVGEVKRPEDHLFSVGKGCLMAAENALQ
jgi:hypothetical protein